MPRISSLSKMSANESNTLPNPIKICFASSDYRSLKIFGSTLQSEGNLDGKLKPCIQKYCISKKVSDSITMALEVLTTPFDQASSSELTKHDDFRRNALNIVYINKSDDQIPDVLLESIKNLTLSNTVYLYERGIDSIDIFKHNLKISRFTHVPHRYLQGVLFEGQQTLLKLRRIVLNYNNLQSIKELSLFDVEKVELSKGFINLSCHTHDVVSDKDRQCAISFLKKTMLDQFNKLKLEISEIQEYIITVFGEKKDEDTLETLCEVKAKEVDADIYNEINGSLKKYKEIYCDTDKIRSLCFGKEDPTFNLESPLGKRSREDFGASLRMPDPKKLSSSTLATSVKSSERLKYQTLLKNELLKVLEYSQKKINKLERKIDRLLGKTDPKLTIEKRCELRAISIEAGLYDQVKTDSNEYLNIVLHQKFNIDNSFSSQELSFLKKPKSLFGPMFSTPVLKNVNPAPRYEWFYSGCGFPLINALKGGKEIPCIYKGPVDEKGNDRLEHLYRNSKYREFMIKLDGFPSPVVVNLDTFEITFKEHTFKALAREVTFLGQPIDIPPFWSEYQDTMIKVEDLELTELPDLDLGVEGKKVQFVDTVNKEIQKVHPKAIVKSVKRIQNFQHLNNFNLECQVMVANNDALDQQEDQKKAANIKHEEPGHLPHGSNKAEPNEINNDALDQQKDEKKAVNIKHEEPGHLPHGSNKAEPNEINNDALDQQKDEKKAANIKHEEPYFLFYGSNKTHPNEIIYQSNGVPLANTHFDPNENWGNGIHLSTSFIYADRCSYAYYDPAQKVIVKRVFIVVAELGYCSSVNCDPKLRRPHSRGLFNGMPVYYDSLTGKYSSGELNTDVYIVYKSDRVLPAFVIEYTVPFEK